MDAARESIVHPEHLFVLLLYLGTLAARVHGLVIFILEDDGIIIAIDFHAIAGAGSTQGGIRAVHMYKDLGGFEELDLLMFGYQKL
jgi:hypothetical protein